LLLKIFQKIVISGIFEAAFGKKCNRTQKSVLAGNSQKTVHMQNKSHAVMHGFRKVSGV